MHILTRIPYWGFWALLIYMPFHIFLSQSLSLATGGLEVWKVGKDVVLAVLVLFTICLVLWQRKANKLFAWLLGLSAAYGLLYIILWAINSDVHTQSAVLGIVHNMRLPAFLLLGMGAALLNPNKFVFSSVIKIVLAVSTAVAALGILQYFLPKDILVHLGYSLERGVRPHFFIDDHPDLPRIMSTLREPNALGAYLVLPVAALTALLVRVKNTGLRYMVIGSLALHLLAILLTHSRSAWLATALVVALTLWWSYREWVERMLKRFWPLLIALVLATGVAAYHVRDTAFFQGYIIHTTELATGEHSSTELHYLLAREGFERVVEQPHGYGPGTAGLASIQSPVPQLTENYYIQVMYEIGVVGFGVFVVINVVVYRRLWTRRDTFGVIMVASFWGYVLTNMLLHSWANEAIAAQWWLLAGAGMVALNGSKKKIGASTALD